MKSLKRLTVALLIACSFVFVAPAFSPLFESAYTVEAASMKMNKTSLTLCVGGTYKLKVKNATKKATWSTSNKKVAKVNKNGTVTALKTGKATITAKVGNKKFKTTVKVTKSPKLSAKANIKRSGNITYIEAKVKNKTNSNLDNAIISVDLYNASNKKIGTVSSSIFWIDAAGTWKTTMQYYSSKEVIKYCKVSNLSGSYNSNHFAYTKFTSLVSSCKKTSSYNSNGRRLDTYTVKGKIQNKTGKKIKSVFVTYGFYDKNGNILSTRFCGYYKGYKNKAKFKIKEKSHNIDSSYGAVTCKIVEVHGYTI